ncbi:hypothetical protein BANRA_05225 [Klebsiella pneumoniae]|nr:hypothetical protein BANRA_05225 [Klebsiella pneumoniae]
MFVSQPVPEAEGPAASAGETDQLLRVQLTAGEHGARSPLPSLVVGSTFSASSNGRLAATSRRAGISRVGDLRLTFRRQHVIDKGFGIVGMLAGLRIIIGRGQSPFRWRKITFSDSPAEYCRET